MSSILFSYFCVEYVGVIVIERCWLLISNFSLICNHSVRWCVGVYHEWGGCGHRSEEFIRRCWLWCRYCALLHCTLLYFESWSAASSKCQTIDFNDHIVLSWISILAILEVHTSNPLSLSLPLSSPRPVLSYQPAKCSLKQQPSYGRGKRGTTEMMLVFHLHDAVSLMIISSRRWGPKTLNSWYSLTISVCHLFLLSHYFLRNILILLFIFLKSRSPQLWFAFLYPTKWFELSRTSGG